MPKQAWKLLSWQAVFALFFIIFYAVFQGVLNGLMAGYGASIAIVCNLLLGCCLFRKTGALEAKAILRGFYFGEVLKFLLVIILFFLAIVVWNFAFLPLICGYIFSQFMWYFSLLLRV